MTKKQEAALKRTLKANLKGATRGVFEENGMFVSMNAFYIIRTFEDPKNLPHTSEILFSVSDYLRRMKITEEELLLFPYEYYKEYARQTAAIDRPFFPVKLGPSLVNPLYLCSIMEALPHCTAYYPYTFISPIFFTSEQGDAILMPVKPNKKLFPAHLLETLQERTLDAINAVVL